MRKLSEAVDRFAYRHPRFGIPNLMLIIVFGNIIVYLLSIFAGPAAVSFLAFRWQAILDLELWRLVTFVFMPGYYSTADLLWLALFLYFYYMIGSALEREWGTAKFSLYYLAGMVLTILAGAIVGLATGGDVVISDARYVNLSMFFAYAVLYPETRVLVFYIIPVKIKWLAWIDAAFFAISVIVSLVRMNILGVVLPIVALLNFVVFFWTKFADEISWRRSRHRHQRSPQTIHFKAAARQQAKKAREQGYRHKCEVCGRTDADYPDLQFRYCSRCAGYHCFCQDHIFNHVHFTE